MASSSEAQSQRWTEHHRTQLPGWKRPALCRIGGASTLSRDKPSRVDAREVGGKSCRVETSQKVLQLEKNISFLRQQHRDTLQQLHREIERLKKDNRDLNFRLIMCRCRHSAGEGKQHTGSRSSTRRLRVQSSEDTEPGTPNDELRAFLLEEEVQDLRNALAEEKSRNTRLMRVVEQKMIEQQKSVDLSGADLSGARLSLVEGAPPVVVEGSRPPTLEECQSIIQHLQHTNEKQSHELVQIKADLHDVLYSHKWTPNAYLMARAYVADNRTGEGGMLPKIAVPSHKKSLERAYQRVQEGITLPALHPRVPNSFAERKKRAHTLRWRTGQ